MNDVIVLLPGIMGSALQDRSGKEVWGTSMGTLVKGVLTGARAIKRLRLPDGIGDDPAPDGVTASAIVPDIHVVPGIWAVSVGYERQRRWLRDTFELVEDGDDSGRPANFVPFAYDWRLSNRATARALQARVEPILDRFRAQPGHADAKLIFIGHSMGGLVARYYVDVLGGHEVTRKVITLGTPYRGAANALESLVNGIAKGWGPVKIDLTELARSLPSLHQLLPEYACIESPGGLRKTTEVDLPELDRSMVADAMRFHDELRDSGAQHGSAYDAHPVLARTQPTWTTATLRGGRIDLRRTIDGRDELGDGTVPRLSAAPYGVEQSDPIIRYVMDKHGALPANEPATVELEGVLTANDVVARGADYDVGVTCDDMVAAGSPIDVTVETEDDLVVDVAVHGESGTSSPPVKAAATGDGTYRATLAGLPPGRYVMAVSVRGSRDVVSNPVVALAAEEGVED
jgi:hypothetical protein